MSDPGSIVGAVSLLLQLLQGLHAYYVGYRNQSEDIRNILTQVQRAQAIITTLDTPIQHLLKEGEPLSTEVQSCVASCSEAQRRLAIHLNRLTGSYVQNNTIPFRKRLLYPLRKPTLIDLQQQLAWLLNHLQLLMHALHLNTTVQFHADITERTTAIHAEVRRIHCQQTYQTELLEEFRKESEKRSHLVNSLVLDVIRLLGGSQRRLPNQSALKTSCERYTDIIEGDGKKPYRIPISYCTCGILRRKNKPSSTKQWGPFGWSKQTAHPPPCPLATVTEGITSTSSRLKFCCGGLRYLIEASLTWSNSAVSPYILFRCIVPRSSSLFALVDAYSMFVTESGIGNEDSMDVLKQNIKATQLTMRAIRRLIQSGRGNVRDVDPSGNTLAHIILHSLGYAVQREPHSIHFLAFLDVLLSFTQLLQDLGCDLNEENDSGSTPVSALIIGSTTPVPAPIPVMRSMIDKVPWTTIFGCFELSTDFLTRLYRDFYHQESGRSMVWPGVYSQLKTDHESGPFCLDGPLLRAVTVQDEGEVRKILKAPRLLVQRENHDFSIWRALSWPNGLELLLSHGYLEDTDYPGILEAAFHCGYTAVVDMLLQSPCFDHVMWPAAVNSGNVGFMRIVASTLYSRFCEPRATGLILAGERARPAAEYCAQLYSLRQDRSSKNIDMTADAAQVLHETGHPYSDVNDTTTGTPLWYLSVTSPLPLQEYLNLMAWLASHGASTIIAHPFWGTMPLHHIAGRISLLSLELLETSTYTLAQHFGYMREDTERETDLAKPDEAFNTPVEALMSEFVRSIFQSDQTDDCRCLCTLSGCSVVSSVLKAALHHIEIDPLDLLKRLRTSWALLSSILPPEILKRRSFCDSVIRASTFEALQLSHTCHSHRFDPASTEKLLDSDIEDIRYVEQADVRTFEALMEDFRHTLCKFEGTVMEFMEGPWTACMNALIEEKNKLSTSKGAQEMENVGVRLDVQEPPKAEAPEPSYDLTWFQHKIDAILDGCVS